MTVKLDLPELTLRNGRQSSLKLVSPSSLVLRAQRSHHQDPSRDMHHLLRQTVMIISLGRQLDRHPPTMGYK